MHKTKILGPYILWVHQQLQNMANVPKSHQIRVKFLSFNSDQVTMARQLG